MTHKIVRADGTTIQNVKSCVYAEDVNGEENLRPGCVSSAHIEVTVYGNVSSAPEAGEKLTYYQVSDSGTETKIGYFYAEPAINSRMTYKFLAYDGASKLDIDFSERLQAIQSSFPLPLSIIAVYAASEAGLSFATSTFPLASLRANAFYADNITCRQVLSWVAEIAGCFVRCNSEGLIEVTWYSEKEGYRIYPTTTNLPIIIRQPIDASAPAGTYYLNVLASNVTEYQWQYQTQTGTSWLRSGAVGAQTNRVRISINATRSGYKFRCRLTNANGYVFTDVVTTILDEDGEYVEPTQAPVYSDTEQTVAYKQNGLSYEGYEVRQIDGVSVFSADENAITASYPVAPTGDNIYSVYNNLLLTDVDSTTLSTVAQNIYTAITSLPPYRPARISLFPSENPFRAGDIVAVTDAQGVSFTTLAMSMTTDLKATRLRSTGSENYEEIDQETPKSKIYNLANAVLRVKKLIADEIEAITARINTLFANEITVTGSLHSPDYQVVGEDSSNAQPYAASGLGIELGDGSINGQYFAVDKNGGVFSREAYFGDFYFTDAINSAETQMSLAPLRFVDSGGVVSTNYEEISAVFLVNNTFDGIRPRQRRGIDGYKVNEAGTLIYRIDLGNSQIRYFDFNALAESSIVSSLEKPVAKVIYHPSSGRSYEQGSVTMTYGSYEASSARNALLDYKDSLFYPPLPVIADPGSYLTVEISVPAGAFISVDVVRGFYSAWYGSANGHTYGGTGTYLGTDGISAAKMAIGGTDLASSIFYYPGDQYRRAERLNFIGVVTAYSPGQRITFNVQTDKILNGVSTATVTVLNGRVFGPDGFLVSSAVNFLGGNYTVSTDIRGTREITVFITSQTEFPNTFSGGICVVNATITIEFS